MIWIITFWILMALGLAMVGSGLFWDRPGWRGRPARWCCRCRYDLSDAGDVPVKCSECGKVHVRERSLRRVRRHKRVVAVGVVVLIGSGVLALTPAGLRGDLMKPLPNRVLVELQPLFPEQWWGWKNHPSGELSDRLMDTTNPISHDDVVVIIDDLADGSIFASAGTQRWGRTSGRWFGGQAFRLGSKEQGWHYPDGVPADEALLGAIDRMMSVLPKWHPTTRARWPEGYRVTIESGFFHPRWPTKGDVNERAILRLKGHGEIISDGFIHHFDIDPVGKAGDVIEGEIELSYYRVEPWDKTQSREPVKTKVFPISWRVVSDVRDAVDLVEDPEIESIVLSEFVTGQVSSNPDYVDRQSGVWTQPRFDDLGMGVVVLYSNDAGPIRNYHLHWFCRDGKLEGPTMGGDEFVPYAQAQSMVDQALLDGTLRIKITGDPAEGLELLDVDRLWVGEIDMLYSDALIVAESAKEEAPPESTAP